MSLWRQLKQTDTVTETQPVADGAVQTGQADPSTSYPAPQPAELDVFMLEPADPDEDIIERPGGLIAAIVVSLLIHICLMSNMSQILVDSQDRETEPPLLSHFIDEEVEQSPLEPESVRYELANPDEKEHEVREVLNATSVGMIRSATPKVESAPRLLAQDVAVPSATAIYDIPQGLEVDDRLVVKGTTGESLVQIESALDLVTWEIAKNLQEQRVLVVWLLDASGSLNEQRQAIAKRLRRVYGELDALRKTDQIPRHKVPLLSGVVTFGEKTNFITPNPTENFDEILSGIQSAPIDTSGVENVFTAIGQVLNNWAKYRTEQSRRIMLITVTDEAGDDFGPSLERAIVHCQRMGAKAYVVGPSAVFGRRDGYIPYVAPEDGKTYRLPIALGPEVPVFDNIELPFWYNGPQFEYLSSGFAPYALARLVHETGGIYFMTTMTTMSGLAPIGVFDPATMRPFEPDYSFGSPEAYERDLRKHPLRWAVVDAAIRSRRYTAKGTPPLDLRVTAQNFKQSASDAQKSVAESQAMIEMVMQAFPEGIEKELAKEPSPRWRMNFCLAYGRLLAQKIRCMEYNSAFAWLKNELTPDDVAKKSNHWIVRPDRTLNYSGNLKKQAQKAEELLQRVMREGPGTPWAVLAARELKDPVGIKIDQRFIPPPPPAPPASANGTPPRRVLFAEEEQRRQRSQPAAPPKPPVLPKL